MSEQHERIGRFARLKPIENFFLTRADSNHPLSVGSFGRGAWELAGRYSWVDLSSASFDGGIMESVTFGVNWYWNYNFRMQFNYYIHTLRGCIPILRRVLANDEKTGERRDCWRSS